MQRNMLTLVRGAMALVIFGLVTGCSAAASPSAPSSPSPASPAATIVDRQVSESDNGQSIAVPVGSRVTLLLHNTYWQVQGSSDSSVLGLVSGPTASGAALTACVPGSGCGTVSAVFRALGPGRATITASRTTCGEALLCTGTAGGYEVTISVGG